MNTLRGVLLATLLTALAYPALAQTTRDPAAHAALEKMSEHYSAMPSFSAKYLHQSEGPDGKVVKKLDGTILVQGNKYALTIPGYEIICDGKTLWSYVKETNEVNISDYAPDDDEITPNTVFDVWKKGYKYILLGEFKAKDGKTVQTIDLEPDDITREVTKVRMIVNKADHSLKKWIVYERGTGNRQVFNVMSFTPNVKIGSGAFAFNKGKHPGVKVVDLR
jgi:outer membrane lipoprotein-sorting protein